MENQKDESAPESVLGDSNNTAEFADVDLGVDDTVIAELKTKFGNALEGWSTEKGAFIVARPNRAIYLRFINKASSEPNKGEAMEELALSCMVWPQTGEGKPDYGAGRAIFANQPGLATTIAGKLIEMAGGGDATQSKKL